MGIAYRLGQFWQLVTAHPLSPEAWQEVATVLSPQELALFRRFDRADQQHSYRVLRTLRQAGHEDPDLLAAALLHDIGKIHCRPQLWERVLGAILEKIAPRRARAWGAGDARGWRRALAIRRQHPEWGSYLAQEAGSCALTIELIRRHQDEQLLSTDEHLHRLLAALQWADNRN
ncbi:MAG TPA: HD domain-containing protein [Candidatus Sulfomarinibacteraceae bacterium]|nr:HD domain-containing protein [Candidatus Sulfomarinibacteraceae bacterium]